MKDLIAVAEKDRENRKSLVMENVDKITMAEVVKVSNAIDLGNKYSWIISNGDIDVAGDLKLTDIKKYWRCVGQIQDGVDGLHKNKILALEVFVKHFWKMHNNEHITENMMIRREIDPKCASLFFV